MDPKELLLNAARRLKALEDEQLPAHPAVRDFATALGRSLRHPSDYDQLLREVAAASEHLHSLPPEEVDAIVKDRDLPAELKSAVTARHAWVLARVGAYVICERFASGETLSDIAESLGVTEMLMVKFLNATEQNRKLFKEAKTVQAWRHVHEAGLAAEIDHSTKMKHHHWMAERLNPGDFALSTTRKDEAHAGGGDRSDGGWSLTINLGDQESPRPREINPVHQELIEATPEDAIEVVNALLPASDADD